MASRAKHRRLGSGRRNDRGPESSAKEVTGVRTWLLAKRPVFRFVLICVVCVVVLNLVLLEPLREAPLLNRYLAFKAQIGAWVLRVFGEDAFATGRDINSPRFVLTIAHGCDAVQPTGLFLAAVLATPARLRAKLAGMIVGYVALFAINLVRIVSLYYIGVHWPSWFQVMHVDVWAVAFIMLSVVLWIAWASWALPRRSITPVSRRASHAAG